MVEVDETVGELTLTEDIDWDSAVVCQHQLSVVDITAFVLQLGTVEVHVWIHVRDVINT